jgi:hypothetical protein
MINAATVGVNDHKVHITGPSGSSRNLINKAAPMDMHSTRTEKMADLLVSVSFGNIPCSPSLLAEELARRSCPMAGGRPGGGPRSRRRAGSDPTPSRGVLLPRNETTILLVEAERIPQMSDLSLAQVG